MKRVVNGYFQLTESITKLDWLPVLLARISLGSIFILSGWGKLHAIEKVTEFFIELGIPFAGFNAVFVGLVEFICGLLLLFGLLTRLASVPLIATMIVALFTAKLSDTFSLTDFLAFEEFVYVVILLWFLIVGAGKVSLDQWLNRGQSQQP